VAETYRTRYTACATWLWREPMNIVPAKTSSASEHRIVTRKRIQIIDRRFRYEVRYHRLPELKTFKIIESLSKRVFQMNFCETVIKGKTWRIVILLTVSYVAAKMRPRWYWSLTCNSLMATHELLGNPWSIGTRNCRQPLQWPINSIIQIRLKIRMNTDAIFRNCQQQR